MMLDEQDKGIIRGWAKTHPAPLPLRLVTTDDLRSDNLQRFALGVAALAPALEIRHETEVNGGAPVLAVGERIRYHAVPAGPELPPFLNAISGDGHDKVPLSATLQGILAALDRPALLRLFISPLCPFCPEAARRLISLAEACVHLSLTVIDGFLFSEMAEAGGVRSVPTVLLEPGFQWTGTPDLEEIARAMTDRDSTTPGANTLRNLIETGSADRVARMIVDRGHVFPALFDLLTHTQWPVRLGAMVAMEHLAAERPDIAAQGADPLWQRFAGTDDRVQGDLLHVLGEIAPSAMADAIETATQTCHQEEVREAAMEAVEKIRHRAQQANGASAPPGFALSPVK